MLLGKKGMKPDAPIFVRIFKEESELEVWKQRDDGRFYHFKTYPICNWSGNSGRRRRKATSRRRKGSTRHARPDEPELRLSSGVQSRLPQRLRQSPQAHRRFLMVHGKCKSAGCYAMTDALIEEIYALAREAFIGGNQSFQVHAFPFRMTPEKLRPASQGQVVSVLGDAQGRLRLLRDHTAGAARGCVRAQISRQRQLHRQRQQHQPGGSLSGLPAPEDRAVPAIEPRADR